MSLRCKICEGRVLNHSLNLLCSVCYLPVHRECIPLSRDEFKALQETEYDWMCTICLEGVFPFNHYHEEEDYLDSIFEFTTGIADMHEKFSEKIFIPFEINDFEQKIPIFEIDPDLHFFNEMNKNMIQNSNYFMEETLNHLLDDKFPDGQNIFSLCHLNMRSVPAHLDDFLAYIDCLHVSFTVIGFTETWLTNDSNFLYDIPGYDHVGNHRSNSRGGGVSIHVKQGVILVATNLISSNQFY